MIRIRALPALLIAAAIGSGMAHAAHISFDSVFGPDTITRDTNTGLDWLDLSVTQDLTTSQLVPLLSGSLSGWRYATIPERNDFLAPYRPLTPATVRAFVDIIGGFTTITGARIARGVFNPFVYGGDLSGENCQNQGGADDCWAIYSNIVIYSDNTYNWDGQQFNYPVVFPGWGHYLIRTGTAIPEPSTLWLLCGGLAVVLAVRATKEAFPRVFRW